MMVSVWVQIWYYDNVTRMIVYDDITTTGAAFHVTTTRVGFHVVTGTTFAFRVVETTRGIAVGFPFKELPTFF